MTAITEVMTPDPTTVDQRDPLSAAVSALDSAPYHHLVVMDGDEAVGMLSTTDILRVLHDADREVDGSFRDYVDQTFTIEDAMTPELCWVTVDASVKDAAEALGSGRFHSVAVLDGTRLAGIVTTTDLVRHLAAITET